MVDQELISKDPNCHLHELLQKLPYRILIPIPIADLKELLLHPSDHCYDASPSNDFLLFLMLLLSVLLLPVLLLFEDQGTLCRTVQKLLKTVAEFLIVLPLNGQVPNVWLHIS